MFDFLRRLVSKPTLTEQIEQTSHETYNSGEDADRLGLAFYSLLQGQLELIGYGDGNVPAVEPYTSEKCRGYLFGLALGIPECEGIKLVGEGVGDALMAAFGLVYEEGAAFDLAVQTEQEMRNRNQEVEEAANWGLNEVRAIYGGSSSNAVGFYLAVQGRI